VTFDGPDDLTSWFTTLDGEEAERIRTADDTAAMDSASWSRVRVGCTMARAHGRCLGSRAALGADRLIPALPEILYRGSPS
jgi:hypothetical protein